MTADEARPIIEQYSAGKLSLLRAAAKLGHDVSVSEVVVWTYQLGLEPPRPPREVEIRQLEDARRLLGLTGGRPVEETLSGR